VNLDHCTVVVRERSIPELYDLALALGRKHFFRLAPLLVVAAGPWTLFDWWLLRGLGWGAIYPFFLLLCAQAPLVTAPLTAYLGEAMFDPTARARPALAAAGSRWKALFLVGSLRGLASVIPFVLLWFPPHLVEVLLLERQPLKPAWRRAVVIASDWRTQHGSHSLLGLMLVPLGIGIAAWAGATLVEVLVWGLSTIDDIMPLLDPGECVLPLLMAWPIIGYLAVVRFLAYIDLRTRNEGWDVELDLRRAARRIEPEAA
jgi:hypothetical protein